MLFYLVIDSVEDQDGTSFEKAFQVEVSIVEDLDNDGMNPFDDDIDGDGLPMKMKS